VTTSDAGLPDVWMDQVSPEADFLLQFVADLDHVEVTDEGFAGGRVQLTGPLVRDPAVRTPTTAEDPQDVPVPKIICQRTKGVSCMPWTPRNSSLILTC
jgi:hypothetical protein